MIRDGVSDGEVDDITRSYSFGPFIYGGAGLIAFASPWTSAALFLAIPAFYLLPLAQWRASFRRA